MGQVATTHLLDFLYRDPTRLASLYAQVFGGHLLSAEVTHTARTGTERGLGFTALLKGDMKATKDATESRKDAIAPHDTVATDLIRKLVDLAFVRDDFASAPNGSLVRASGSLSFGDGSMFGLFAELLADSPEMLASPGKKPTSADKKLAGQVTKFLKNARIPSSFQIATAGGKIVAGHVKDAGLDEPIASFYFKHGDESLPGVSVIGVKEVASARVPGLPHQLVHVTHALAAAFQKMIFPADAVRVTPVAIYRTIHPSDG